MNKFKFYYTYKKTDRSNLTGPSLIMLSSMTILTEKGETSAINKFFQAAKKLHPSCGSFTIKSVMPAGNYM